MAMSNVTEAPSPGKREARRLERRQAIIEIAAHSFMLHGYAATSMSAIAAELGGSKGTLWNYFPSKEDLFAAVLDDRIAAYRERLGALLDAEPDVRTALTDFCRGFIAKITSPDALALHRLVSAESGRFPELGAAFYRRAPEMTRIMVAGFLKRQMATGKLRLADPLQAARILLCLCSGGSQQEMLWGRPAPDDATLRAEADFAVDIFMRAYAI